MTDIDALNSLSRELGVATEYRDGFGRVVTVSPETLAQVCAALGADVTGPGAAGDALAAHRAAREEEVIPPVLVAWDGRLPAVPCAREQATEAQIVLEDGSAWDVPWSGALHVHTELPAGYHRLLVRGAGRTREATVISAPTMSWRSSDAGRRWGLGAQLAALRSDRSRSVGDLSDLRRFCRWTGSRGGNLVSVLPLLPTFNREPAEPSPYSPVSRLFWSELMLDLGGDHRPAPPPRRLDVTAADREVRAAFLARGDSREALSDASAASGELKRYARFRGAQARLGRNWRDWPDPARRGRLDPSHVDPVEESFHFWVQAQAQGQLADLRRFLDETGVRLGLDLAVGVHPDGYDVWSRQSLHVERASVGAPPDPGFPSGQNWGFPPVHPGASRAEGHRYVRACVAHQAALADVLRIDHVMALDRLYWIPEGAGRGCGTYVQYPREELFAVLTLEAHRHQCEMVGENLGTVPQSITTDMARHGIRGMRLAVFEAGFENPEQPTSEEVAFIGTHDTPTFAGWTRGADIDERVDAGLLDGAGAPTEWKDRAAAVRRLADVVGADGVSADTLAAFLRLVLLWQGGSASPLVIPWVEDLWLEGVQVNLPGTSTGQRANWQRPMSRTLDELESDQEVAALLAALHAARDSFPGTPTDS